MNREPERSIAYFSMEVGIDDAMPTYSGGLGILAADTIRSAADLKVPMVAVTLLYRQGYLRQRLSPDGWQVEEPVSWKVEDFLQELRGRVSVEMALVDSVLGPRELFNQSDILGPGDRLNLSCLALRCSPFVNGVAKSHGEVSRRGETRGADHSRDAGALYDKLENVILPMFYADRARFIDVMANAIAFNASFINTQRMIQQYVLNAYFG